MPWHRLSMRVACSKWSAPGIRNFIFLSGKQLYFFLGLCYYSDKFPNMFCSSCGMECRSTANFCHQCGQQLNLSQVSNKAASSVNKEKLLKKYFHREYPYAALITCTSDCGSRCFKVLWLLEMRMRKRHLFCTGSHHNVPYEKQQQLNKGSEPWNECPCWSACAIAKYALH